MRLALGSNNYAEMLAHGVRILRAEAAKAWRGHLHTKYVAGRSASDARFPEPEDAIRHAYSVVVSTLTRSAAAGSASSKG